jgi:hypothetical protein
MEWIYHHVNNFALRMCKLLHKLVDKQVPLGQAR